ncbi:hypothetical protein [Mesomycoplasma lagogenitalium]|uniref:Uncharacterized protein n=1 Tax=Mesomycoplasma lagogenitalium TaxID=171286 RepID=A0ABY8LUQ4_9BACT|nr:hypothetical protein [Mesomycoplasma lagogenitalium]WGI36967.1 hypothetical protein QEG99_01635 [Mesomycoplasma lagogenitalium]
MNNNKTLVSLKEATKIIKQYEKHQCKIDFKDEKKCRIIMEGEKLKMQETSEKKITLKSLYNLVLNMQIVLLDVQKQTNENSADIKEIKIVQAEHSRILQEHSQDIKEIKTVQAEHSRILQEHSQDIKEIKTVQAQHSKILQEHSQDIKEMKEDIKMLKSFHEDDIKKYKDKK